jgi:hypothetical protein
MKNENGIRNRNFIKNRENLEKGGRKVDEIFVF